MSLVAFEAGKPLFDARCSGTTATSIVLSNERTSAVLLLHSSTADLQVWHAIVVFSSGFLWPMWVIRVQSWDRVLECLGFALDTLHGTHLQILSEGPRFQSAQARGGIRPLGGQWMVRELTRQNFFEVHFTHFRHRNRSVKLYTDLWQGP